jgi:hypothetical protein
MDIVVLKRNRRDWALEGTAERNACHTPVRDDLVYQFSKVNRANVRVLV